MSAYLTILRSVTLGGDSFLALSISWRVFVFVGSVLISRCALGEQGRGAECIVSTEPAFNDDIDTVGECVGSDAAIDDVISLRTVGHPERDLSSARIAHDRAVDDTRANFDTSLIKRRIGFRFRRELAGRQVVDAGVLDRARGEIARGANDEGAADEELCAWLHDLNIRECTRGEKARDGLDCDVARETEGALARLKRRKLQIK